MKSVCVLLLGFVSFNCFSTMCGEPEFIDEVSMPAIVFVGYFESVEYTGESPVYFEKLGKEVVHRNPYQVLLFSQVKVLKGDDMDYVHVKFGLDGGLTGRSPMPPESLGGYYLISFQTGNEDEDGSYAKPYQIGPCNMFKRI